MLKAVATAVPLPQVSSRKAGPSRRVIATPDGACAEVEGDRLRVRATDGAVLFEYDAATGKGTLSMPKDLRLEARGNVEVVAGRRLTMSAREAETRFGTIIERVDNAFRYVKELHQLKAGRLRSLVLGAIHMKGGRMSMKADDDVHIDGRRINLG